MTGTMRSIGFAALAVLTLGACDSMFGDDTWLGGSWFGEPEKKPLPGERISVLLHERTLVPDPKAASTRILLPPPSINPDWPQAGGYANHAMHHTQIGETLGRAWQVDLGSGSDDEERLIAQPVITAGRIFAMDAETTVSAYESDSGRRLWTVELTPDDDDDGHIGGGIATEDGFVYVTTGFAEVIALKAETGAVVWRHRVDAPMRAAPTARGGRLFVVTVDNHLLALDAANGEELWKHTGITEAASLLGGASPAVDAGVVVVPYSSGELVALKVENGRMLWSDSLAAVRRTDVVSTLAHIRGRPVIDRGIVFAVSHGGLMAAIDLRTGRRLWDKEIGGLESPWVAGDYLFTISNDEELLCLARKDGRIHWVTALPRWRDEEDKDDPILWTGPILASDRLIVAGSEGEALAVSPYSGHVLGKLGMPDSVSIAPVVADGTVYFLSDNADLTAYR
jgi:outer membrane protein assembly factor BamB